MNFITALSLVMFSLFALLAVYWLLRAFAIDQRVSAHRELIKWRDKQQKAWKITEPAKKPQPSDDIPVFLKGIEE